MQAFIKHCGITVALDRANVDTDQIIPKQFLKRIERSGFGKFLFFDWRFNDDSTDNTEFELNQPAVKEATVLLTKRNFGSGSSREHAVWALADYGFRCVIAPSYADIFFNNCFKNGVLPIVLPEDQIDQLFANVATHGQYELTIDLESQTIQDGQGLEFSFDVNEFRRHCLLNGLDDIALTLEHETKITAFEQRLS
ncbi:MAG: 3-isopropylmalate dehydratase small subunit [Planctomycetaceae bacterium]|jgi:3-isopropylmalate/(R)-2-methylmalate dehydratase small subunit|nr:3-isopropylmalate dehydratase small subunit [Planctomycetaceae bacterium]MBT4013610.1 3-isopropylmalate dehydratase small subunit [Planctomycetaceae bacterium]MBT4725056.1 3-isopropylmalate dehydratase small subunit [Planctomycetaceae bacterium]MBT4845171.1 3-isopropylmalate dehydratase small subunit [Planctomycetaceae bacterium]MBT5126476.1 3-isopropylmalate dehydratase small subunit [Planctomycetaceae bacterium]